MNTPRFEKTGIADGRIFIGNRCVAEIAAMQLCSLRLAPGGTSILARDVPLPLYWRQYAHHEDPRRNAGSLARVDQIGANEGGLVLGCEGTNSEGEIISRFTLGFSGDRDSGRYSAEIHALLDVAPGKSWKVTHNPSHGELEFCNFWPEGTFRATGGKKSYSVCFVQRKGTVTLIPHTHIESSDKHNIPMHRGDRFGWLLEDENPVIEVLTEGETSAGLCAYMWDAHFGYRVCPVPGSILLEAGTRREARVRISLMGREEAAAIMAAGRAAVPPEDAVTPIYTEGINTFRETLLSFPGREDAVWPWGFEVTKGDPVNTTGVLDSARGYDDARSLRIRSQGPGGGRWLATTLGPAFGGAPFLDGRRYHLSAVASSQSLDGVTRAGLRLHREGKPGLMDPQSYELYWTHRGISGNAHWTGLELITPVISPPPDRMHILLDQDGEGTSWFDNVHLKIYE
jgi:hypothetical protein